MVAGALALAAVGGIAEVAPVAAEAAPASVNPFQGSYRG
jgi:hypothetical protein